MLARYCHTIQARVPAVEPRSGRATGLPILVHGVESDTLRVFGVIARRAALGYLRETALHS